MKKDPLGSRSFTDVVKGGQATTRIQEDIMRDGPIIMPWVRKPDNKDWLNRCVIRVLKDFSSVGSVNNILINRDYSFSSSYLGDKNILWCFDSVIELEGFLKNRFFLDDCFSSMSRWSKSWSTKRKLVCVKIYGVSVSSWGESFFIKLGNQVGTSVLIEKDTFLRRRLNRGNMLILIPNDRKSIGQIHIYMKGKTYLVHMDVEPKPVSFRGMVNDSGGRSKSDLSNQHNHKKGRRIFEKVLDVLSSSPNKNKNQGVGEVGRGRAEVDKGKRLWVRHSKLKRLPIFYENAKLSIGNKKDARPSIPSQKTTSFSSSDQDRGCVLKTVHWKSGMLLKE
ncbi:hypothetical protein LWI28_005779 [Acer negundo]|uniref:DUF4283 domain-containing protein n=1 Tax=Acer negundo TaxID=4023 RepID=A0AAD5J3H5_ACENE|nr:hypothetical protein LWI28_005779 [Acer negundo]